MFNLTQTKNRKSHRLTTACVLGLCLSACEPDNSSILNLGEFFPNDVIAQTVPQNPIDTSPSPIDSGSDTTTGDTIADAPTNTATGDTVADAPTNTATDSNSNTDLNTNINQPTAQFEFTDNQIPIELALLTEGEIITEARFNPNGEPIQDSFILPASGYQFIPDEDVAILSSVSGTTITVCSYIFTTAQYLCLRSFDLDVNDRVWHLFSMQSNTNGAGIFEFCTIENSAEDCLNKLIENPDGTVTITINRTGEAAQLPDASPYFAYGNQATLSNRSADTTDVTISDLYSGVMNSLIKATEKTSLD